MVFRIRSALLVAILAIASVATLLALTSPASSTVPPADVSTIPVETGPHVDAAPPTMGYQGGANVHQVGSSAMLGGKEIVKFDATRPVPRTFDVDIKKFTGSAGPSTAPWLELTVMPQGLDDTGSFFLFKSKDLRPALGLAATDQVVVNVDTHHQLGFTSALVPDQDMDGYQETLVFIPHFSSVWMSVTSSSSHSLFAIWGTGETDLWAVGDHTVNHWNGASWSDVTPSGLGPGSLGVLWTVIGTSTSDVYVAGDYGKLWHYNGATWSALANPWGVADGTKITIVDTAVTPGRIWFVGTDANRCSGSDCAAFVGYYDTYASTWGTLTLPTGSYGVLQAVVATGSSDEMWMAAAHSGSTSGFIMHWNGAWTVQTTFTSGASTINMPNFWAISMEKANGGVWAAGVNGDILHWSGTGWTRSVVGSGKVYLASDTPTPKLTWFACQSCTSITKYIDTSFTSLALPSGLSINGLWSSSSSSVWGVGYSGAIMHYPGMAPPTGNLVAPAASTSLDINSAQSFTVHAGGVDPDLDDVSYTFYIRTPTGAMGAMSGPGCWAAVVVSGNSLCTISANAYAAGSFYWNVLECDGTGNCFWLGADRPVTFIHAPIIATDTPAVFGTEITATKVSGTAYVLSGHMTNPGSTVTGARLQITSWDAGAVATNGQNWNFATNAYTVSSVTKPLTLLGASGVYSWSYTWDTTAAVGGVHRIEVSADGGGGTATKDAFVEVNNLMPGGLWVEVRDHNNDFSRAASLLGCSATENAFASAVINFEWGTTLSCFGSTDLGFRVQGVVHVVYSSTQLYLMDASTTTVVMLDGVTATLTAQGGGLYTIGGTVDGGDHSIVITSTYSGSGTLEPRLKLYWNYAAWHGTNEVPPQNLYYSAKNVVTKGFVANADPSLITPNDAWMNTWSVTPGMLSAMAPSKDGFTYREKFLYRNFGHQGEFYHTGISSGSPLQQDLIVEVHYNTDGAGGSYRPDSESIHYIRNYYNSMQPGILPFASLPEKPLPTRSTGTYAGIKVHFIVVDVPVADERVFQTTPTWTTIWSQHHEMAQAIQLNFAGIYEDSGAEPTSHPLGLASPDWGVVILMETNREWSDIPYGAAILPGEPHYGKMLPVTNVVRSSILHEMGHVVRVGMEDDRVDSTGHYKEVYSNSGDNSATPWDETDFTKPQLRSIVENFRTTPDETESTSGWSVMGSAAASDSRAKSEYQTNDVEGGNDNTNAGEWQRDPSSPFHYALDQKLGVECTGSNCFDLVDMRPSRASPIITATSLTGPSRVGADGLVPHGFMEGFTASATDSEGSPVTIGFDWGDGTRSRSPTALASGVIANLQHAWTTAGTYTVRPFAINDAGVWSDDLNSFTVTVTANVPPWVPTEPTGPTILSAAGTFTTSTMDFEGGALSYTFNWGDTTTTTTAASPSGVLASATHTWATPGLYDVSVYATDSGGAVSDTSRSVCVSFMLATQNDACHAAADGILGDAGGTVDAARLIKTDRTQYGQLDAVAGDTTDVYYFAVKSPLMRVHVTSGSSSPITYILYDEAGEPTDTQTGTDVAVDYQVLPRDRPSLGVFPLTPEPGFHAIAITNCVDCKYSVRIVFGPALTIDRPVAGLQYVQDVPQNGISQSDWQEKDLSPVAWVAGAYDVRNGSGCIVVRGAVAFWRTPEGLADGTVYVPYPWSATRGGNPSCHQAPTTIQGDLTICVSGSSPGGLSPFSWVSLAIDGVGDIGPPSALAQGKICWLWHNPPVGNHSITYQVRDINGDLWGVTKANNMVIA